MSQAQLRVARRFRGPSASGNGGYVAGLLARELGGSCSVSLRRPAPLDRALQLDRQPDSVALFDDKELIALATAEVVDVKTPPAPTLAAARASSLRFAGFTEHLVPECFVCGPDRTEGDGLRIFPGPVDAATDGQVAAEWVPQPDLADVDGHIATEFVWAALDCAGFFALHGRSGPAVLGRIAARLTRPIPACAPLVVTGWAITSEGRKHTVGTALHDSAGALLAAAEGTWIALRQ